MWSLILLACSGLTTFGPTKPECESGAECLGTSETDTDTDPGPGPGPGPDDEDCGRPGDEDGNGRADCEDPACAETCDADGDGDVAEALGGDDCDDTDPRVNPSATEVCNDVDDDCDGDIDDDDGNLDVSTATFWYRDFDQDGYGNDEAILVACDADAEYSAVGGDCDDTSAALSPGVADVPCDEIDNDCNPSTGDDPDEDLDGYGACSECDDGDGAIHPDAEEVCGDGIDSNCDTLDCGAWLEDFEAGLIAPWSSGGVGAWTATTGSAYSGAKSAVSGNINHNQTATVSIVRDFPAGGTIAFWHLESTESGYDYLIFLIDGAEKNRWSGVTAWSMASYAVTAGSHTLEWRYSKDGSVDSGSDNVRIDYVEGTGAVP